jgi:hypothetical protein
LRETALTEKETQLTSTLQLEDAEITTLQRLIASRGERYRSVVKTRIQDFISRREELWASVVRHQQEVSVVMANIWNEELILPGSISKRNHLSD